MYGTRSEHRIPDTQLFRDVFNASPIGIAVESLEGQPVFVNPALCSMLGFTQEEMRGKHCVDFSPPEDAEKDWALFQQLRAGSIDHYQLEKRYFRRDGSLIWGRLSLSLLNHRPSPLVIAMVEDITEQKKAEEARFRHAAIVESSEDAIVSGTLDGMIVTWNSGAQSIYGYTEAEVIGKPISILVPPELSGEEYKILETLRAGNRIENLETVRISKTGKRINVSLTISPIKDSSGKTVGVSGIARDITERKRAEEALLSSERQYRLLFERNVAGVAIASPDGRLLDCNDGWAHILGYESRDELHGRHASEFYFNPAERKPLVDELFEKRVLFSRELQLRRKDGTPVWVLFNAAVHSDHERPIVQCTMIDISEWKSAQEARFRHAAIVESSEDAIISKNLDAVITGWNEAAHQSFGYTEEEAVGQPITILIPPELFEEEQKILEKLKAGQRIEHYETIRVTKTGQRIDMSLSISPIHDATGRIVGFSKIGRDISARKRTEEALRESEQRLRLATQAGRMYAYDWDVARDEVVRSSEHVQILGLTEPLRFPHQQFVNTIHPDDRPKFLGAIAGLTPVNPTAEVSYRVPAPDGTLVWLKSNGRGFFDNEGKLLRVIGMVADITDQKRMEDALRTSEERLRLAVQAARIGTFERDVRTGRITWTEGLESLYGLAPGSLEGKTTAFFKDLIPPDDFERVVHLIEKALKTGEPSEGEWRAIWSDGNVHWIESRWRVLKDESGEPLRVFGVNMDVTERKQAEQALHAQEELLKIFVKNVPAAVAMLDRDMRYLQVSDRWCSDNSVEASEILGRSRLEAPEMPERYKEVNRRALQGETIRADEDRWESGGRSRWGRWEVRPWRNPDGTVGGILIFSEDITRRKQMEEELSDMTRKLIDSQEQERARIGRELHDDVNQRLAMLAVELEQLKENPSAVDIHVQELRKQVTDISNDVQALSHDLHSSKLEYLGVVAGIKSWCKEFAERQGMQIDCRHDLESTLPREIGLSLFRVLQEALHNASKHSGVKRVVVQLLERSGEIHLIVSDTGRGFDVEAASQGKGLGLTSMRERVRLWNGAISIESKPTAGTTIRVRVPFRPAHVSERAVGE